MKRALVIGYDPDHDNHDAIALGRLLASMLAARPIVAAVLPWATNLTARSDLDRQLKLAMQQRFKVIEDELARLEPETVAVAGSRPAAALHEVALANEASVIVLGSAHRGPVGRTLLGSVGESCIHAAPTAVAIAPSGYATRQPRKAHELAVAFDGSAESWTALESGIGLADRCHARLSVLSVADPPRYGYGSAWTLISTGELQDAERDEKRRLAEVGLARIPEAMRGGGRLLSGEPGRRLADASDRFDLMIAGSRGYGPLRRTLLGSATRGLIAASHSPVIVLPRGAGLDPLGVRAAPDSVAATPTGWAPASDGTPTGA